MPRKSEYMYQPTVRAMYALSDAWMKHLGPPDQQASNPHHRSGPPASLYCIERVEEFLAEHADEYTLHLAKRERLSAAARERSQRAAEELVEWAQAAPISHAQWPINLAEACRESLMARGKWIAEPNERHILNMLRHEYSNYHNLLQEMSGRVGCWEAYCVVKERVNSEITARLFSEVLWHEGCSRLEEVASAESSEARFLCPSASVRLLRHAEFFLDNS